LKDCLWIIGLTATKKWSKSKTKTTKKKATTKKN
jgi:hypothetical protein